MCEQNHSFIPSWEKLNCQAGGQTVNESKRENQCLEGMCQLGFDKIWRTNLAAEISSLLITATWSFCCVTNLPKTYDSKRQALNLAQNPMGQPGDSPGLRWPSHPCWVLSFVCGQLADQLVAEQCGMASFTRLLMGRLLTDASTREVGYPPLLFLQY